MVHTQLHTYVLLILGNKLHKICTFTVPLSDYFTNLLPTANKFTSFPLISACIIHGKISLVVISQYLCYLRYFFWCSSSWFASFRDTTLSWFLKYLSRMFVFWTPWMFSLCSTRWEVVSLSGVFCILYSYGQFLFYISIDHWSWNSQWRERQLI